jgi:alkylation response protein AidB-like acyl-CoA dehydrogenase
VDFELSDDQVALRDAAAALLDDRCSLERVRAVADSDGHVDEELWADMAAQGWPAVERSVDDGGLGLGLVDVAVLCEQLGRHLAPVPFLGTVLALGSLAALDEQRADDRAGSARPQADPWPDAAVWAGRLAAGEAVGAVAWSQAATVRAQTGPDGGWRLSGRADPVVYGPRADVIVVVAQTPSGQGVFAFTSGRDGDVRQEAAMDRTRSVGWLTLDDRPAWALGGAEQAEVLIDRAVAGVSAEMLGAAERVLEMTVQYAKDRVQFGRPIGSFQAVKHRCADMLVDVEGMRSASYYAAWAVGASDADARAAASASKVWCSDAARRVMSSGLQVHGGIGFTWEHDLHLFLKRSQLDQVSFGDAGYHRERLARILRPRAEAGVPVL